MDSVISPLHVTQFIKSVLDEQVRHAAAVEAECERLEAEGYRIVGGGQTGGPSNEEWEITGYRTGVVLASGDGYAAYKAASQENYTHIDAVFDSVENDAPERPAWMSEKLASDLQGLVWDNEDEIRALLGRAE